MDRFPPLAFGQETVRLPLAGGTAALLSAGMVDPSPQRTEQIARQFAIDAALTMWAIRSAELYASTCPKSAADLARWVSEHAADAFAADSAAPESSVLPPERIGSLAARWGALVAACDVVDREGAATQLARLAAVARVNANAWLACAGQGAEISDAGWKPDTADESAMRGVEAAHLLLESTPQADWPVAVREAAEAAEAAARLWRDAAGPPFPIRAVARRCEDFTHELEQQKLAAMAEWAAGAGHEINNPLAVISGRAQLLLQQETDADRRYDLATIHAQARRVHEMIAGLMLYAQPPAPVRAEIDVAELLSEVLAECAREGAAARFECEVEPRPLLAWVDPVQLKVAIAALVENAQQAVPAGSEAWVRVEAGWEQSLVGRELRIAVRDNGPGIEPEVRQHIFEPYFSGRSAGRGLGVGLSKCWRIVTSHGGWVEVESDPQVGAVFTVSIPQASVEQSSARLEK